MSGERENQMFGKIKHIGYVNVLLGRTREARLNRITATVATVGLGLFGLLFLYVDHSRYLLAAGFILLAGAGATYFIARHYRKKQQTSEVDQKVFSRSQSP